MRNATPGSRVSSFTGSDSSETDMFPGGDHNFSAAAPNRMARSFHNIKSTMKRATGSSDTSSNIDGSSFTTNPFADDPPFSLPPEPAFLLPSVNFPAAASHQRSLQHTRATTPVRTSTRGSSTATSQGIPRSTSYSDLRSSTPAPPTQLNGTAGGSRSQSRSTDGGGKSVGAGLKDGDLEPYRRTSSKTSLQGSLTRMSATLTGNMNSSGTGAIPADSKATQRLEILLAQPTAKPEASVKAKPGDLIRTQLAGPRGVLLSAEDLQMQRLQQLAHDARGTPSPPKWNFAPLLPSQQGLGSSAQQGSGQSVELALIGAVQALSEDDESREADLEEELQLSLTQPRAGGLGNETWLRGKQDDANDDLSDSGNDGRIPSRGGKPSSGVPIRSVSTGGTQGRKQVSFSGSSKLNLTGTRRQPRPIDRIAHRQRPVPVETHGRFAWLSDWLPARWRRSGTTVELASLRGKVPYSSDDPSSSESSPMAGASPTWTDLRAPAPPSLGSGLQKGSAYMHRYLTTIREKVTAVIDLEAGAQTGESQEDETPRCRGIAVAMCCAMCLILLVGVAELWFRKRTILMHAFPPPAMSSPPPGNV